MHASEFLADADLLPPLVAAAGADPYWRGRVRAELARHCHECTAAASEEEAVALLRGGDLFGGRRLVTLEARGWGRPIDWGDGTLLLLAGDYKGGPGTAVRCDALGAGGLARWAAKRIGEGAAKELVRRVGTDPGVVDAECRKLLDCCPGGPAVEDVQRLCGCAAERSADGFIDALWRGLAPAAAFVQDYVRQEGGSAGAALRLLAKMRGPLGQVALAAVRRKAGAPPAEALAHVDPRRRARAVAMIRGAGTRVWDVHDVLLKTELALRSARDPAACLVEALARLLPRGAGGAGRPAAPG